MTKDITIVGPYVSCDGKLCLTVCVGGGAAPRVFEITGIMNEKFWRIKEIL